MTPAERKAKHEATCEAKLGLPSWGFGSDGSGFPSAARLVVDRGIEGVEKGLIVAGHEVSARRTDGVHVVPFG
jgi:hypothetical protein